MKDTNQSGVTPEQSGAEESTKGFPVITEQDEANAASFEMKKKQQDGSWVAATPVHVTNTAAAEQEKPEQKTADSIDKQPESGAAEESAGKQASADAESTAEESAGEQASADAESTVEQSTDEQASAEAKSESDKLTEEPAVKKTRSPKKKGSRGKHVATAVVGVAAAAVIAFSVYVYTYSSIFPGVRVAGEYKLSGMTQEEAQQYISTEVQNGVFAEELSLTGKDLVADADKNYTIKIADVAQSLDSETSAQQAYLIGREGNYVQRIGTVLNSMFSGWEISLNASIKEDAVQQQIQNIAADLAYEPIQPSWKVNKAEEMLQVDTGKQGVSFDTDTVISDITAQVSAVNLEPYTIDTYIVDQEKPDAAAIAADVNTDPKNATVDKNDGTTVIEAVDGIKVEESAISSAIGDASEQSYDIPIELTKAKITKADLEPVLFRDTLASVTTYYNGGVGGRTTNVRLAARHCDETILNPGEEFSYNDTVGERTAARGFRSAIIYSDGNEVSGLGGGVCQVSSTIYMSVLRANLKVTERSCHQFQVSYTPVSQDAAVYWGAKDFKFVNDTDYPIKIQMSVGGGSLSCTIKGTKTDSTAQVSFSSKSYVSGRYKYATLYKTVTVNGETTTYKENSSTYLLH